MAPNLVLLTGLPGTGKSTLAEAIAGALPATWLSADPIDQGLVLAGIEPVQRPDIAGYEAMKALAELQLRAGGSVVVDAVNPFKFVRDAYAEIARRYGARFVVILTESTDTELHKSRVAARGTIGWSEVERQQTYYEPYDGQCLRLDAANDAAANIRAALAYVRGESPMPVVTIRPYRDGDAPGLHWLAARTPPAGQVAYEPQPREDDIDRIPEAFLAFWVAVHSDGTREGIAGSLGLIDGYSDTEVNVPAALRTSTRTVRLRIMRVAPEVQRTGIGRQLYAAAEAWAVEHDFERIILETTPQQEAAVAFYEAMGFEHIGRSMIGRYELVWFAKAL